jgi:hypothetical protein
VITWVHALWGDEEVATWPKSLHDVQWGEWRAKPKIGKTLTFAYGMQNFRWLRNYGFDPILAHESAVVDFDGTGDREGDGRGARGTFNYRTSMWQHKHDAIQKAFKHGVDEVIWLDWDTKYRNREHLEIFDQLKDGPPFQGRMRHYKNRCSGGGRYNVYHGGCYYLRSPEVFAEADKVRRTAPYVTDEAVITTAVNNVFFGGREVPAEEHRDTGYDNPSLHSLRVVAVPSDAKSLYFEGNMKRSPPFEIEMGKPKVAWTTNA